MDSRKKLLALIVLETLTIVVCLFVLAPGSGSAPAPSAAAATAFVPATALAQQVKTALQAGDFAAFAAVHDWDAIVRESAPEAERASLTPEQLQAKGEELRTAFAAGVFAPLAAKVKNATQFAVNPPAETAVQNNTGKLEIVCDSIDDAGMSSSVATSCTIRYTPGQEQPWRIVSLLNPL